MIERQIQVAVARADLFITSALPVVFAILRIVLSILVGYVIGKAVLARKYRKGKR